MENRSPGAAGAVSDDAQQHPRPEEMETDDVTTVATANGMSVIAPAVPSPIVEIDPVVAAAAREDVEMSGMADTAAAPAEAELNTKTSEEANSVPPVIKGLTNPPAAEVVVSHSSTNKLSDEPPNLAPIRHATPPPPPQASMNVPEFATPTQPAKRELRNIIFAAATQTQAMFMHGSVPPSPVVEPGALHELGNLDSPSRRRSSAVGGIAGLEELRNREAVESEQSRFDQLIQATKLNGDDDSPAVVDAFLRLDFEDGNVYYIKNPSVVFGRAEGTSAGYYSHVGPDGSTIIETGPRGFGRTTSSGLTSMKREKKKRKKKKDELGLVGKPKSTTSGSVASLPSRRSSVFAQVPRFRDPFGLGDMIEAEEPIIHLPLSNTSMENGAPLPPRKNISRRHARLFYNTPKRRFELEIMGKNGAFVNEEYVQAGTTLVVEEKGMKVQIGGISFTVIVPEIPPEQESEEELPPPPSPKFTGGKGKMSFAFHDENGDEVNYSENEEDEDVEMEDHEQNSEKEGSSENDSGQESEEEDEEEGESGEDADEEDDQEESSEEEGVDPSPSPEPTRPARPRPTKSVVDIRRREQELQRDRDRIKELQRQLKEKEREKAEAEAEALRIEREEQRAQEREQERRREKEKERERAREKERERIKEERRKKKAAEKALEIQRQKEVRQKEKEQLRAAKERERERERERKKQQKLHLPQPAPPLKKEQAKLILPTISSGRSTPIHSQSPALAAQPPREEMRPPPALLLPQPSTTSDSTPALQPQPQPQPQLQPPAHSQPTPQQFKQMQHQHQHQYDQQQMDLLQHQEFNELQQLQQLQQFQLQLQSLPQYATASSSIDPALYQTAPQMMHDPNMMQHHRPPIMEKPKKEKPPPRQKKLRSPSPEINEADLPPESLVKPNVSYVVMIHEAILNSADKVLSLPQIYKAIETKYPYYKFKVQTQGWQSSVRHNLGQHKAFYKVDRAGKGWLWGVVDGVSIEKEKKGSAAKQTMPIGYDAMHGQNGQGMMHPQNGQMMGHMGQLPPGFQQQQPMYQGANGTNGMQPMVGLQPSMMPHQPMHQQPQQIPPPPSYMPMKQPQQPNPTPQQPNPRAFEAPIPMPTGAMGGDQKPDVKQVIAVLTKIVAQRQAHVSSDPNANKTLEQLKGFLAQLASGKTNPVALQTVSNLVNSFKQQGPATATPMDSSPPAQTSQGASPPPPPTKLPPGPTSMNQSSSQPAPMPSALAVGPAASALPASATLGGQTPSTGPAINLSNLGQHIKNLSPEERAKWTKKLLALKQQKAAAAAAGAQSPPAPSAPSVPVPVPVHTPVHTPVLRPAPPPPPPPRLPPTTTTPAPVPVLTPVPVNAPSSVSAPVPISAPGPVSAPMPAPMPTTSPQSLPTTTAGNVPMPALAGKDLIGLGAPAAVIKAPLAPDAIKTMSPELVQQYLAKVKATQGVKRPADNMSAGGDSVNAVEAGGGSGEPPAKKVDVGTRE